MTKGEIKQLYQDYPAVLYKLGLSLDRFDDDEEEIEVDLDKLNAMIQEVAFNTFEDLDELMSDTDEPILDDFGEETDMTDTDWDGALAILNEEGF